MRSLVIAALVAAQALLLTVPSFALSSLRFSVQETSAPGPR